MITLKVPLADSFEKNLHSLKPDDLFSPIRILSESEKTIMSDHVLYHFLISSCMPRNILDLGCFFGMTPFVVEDIGRSIDHKSNDVWWHLVDNHSYTKIMKETILSKKSTNQFREWQTHSWIQSKLIPETTAQELREFWKNLSEKRNISLPNIDFSESIENNFNIFDMIIFDLNAGQFKTNYKMFLALLEKNMNDNSILILDDIRSMHPQQIALYQEIISRHGFSPIAFSLAKVALVSKTSKNKIMDQIKYSMYSGHLITSNISAINKTEWFHLKLNTESNEYQQGSYFYVAPRFFYQNKRNSYFE